MAKQAAWKYFFVAVYFASSSAAKAQAEPPSTPEASVGELSPETVRVLQEESRQATATAESAAEATGMEPEAPSGTVVASPAAPSEADAKLATIRDAVQAGRQAQRKAEDGGSTNALSPLVGEPVSPSRRAGEADFLQASGVATEAAASAAAAAMKLAADAKRAAADAAEDFQKKQQVAVEKRQAAEQSKAAKSKPEAVLTLQHSAESASHDADDAKKLAQKKIANAEVTDKAVDVAVKAAEESKKATDKASSLDGKNDATLQSAFGFSMGLGADFHSRRYVETASVNGTDQIVTVDNAYKVQPSVWAVAGYTKLTPCPEGEWYSALASIICNDDMRPGLFFGAKLLDQSGESVTAMALGIQVSFLEPEFDNVAGAAGQVSRRLVYKQGWNIGIGFTVHKTQELADQIVEGKPLPSQYSGIKYSNSFSKGFMVMISHKVF